MANNFVQEGNSIEFTAPTGGVVSGGLYIIGSTVIIASVSAAEGERFNGRTHGVWTIPKAGSVTANEGEAAKWLASSNQVSDSASAKVIGVFTEAAENGKATCNVRLVQTVVA